LTRLYQTPAGYNDTFDALQEATPDTVQYYLTNVEIEVLETSAIDIVRQIQPNSMLVELGSGCFHFLIYATHLK